MELFKNEKKQPIKFRGFNFIGYHKDYEHACYYYKVLPRDNFELMECMLEGYKKPEIGAGTTVSIIDTFMSNYLNNEKKGKKFKKHDDFIKDVIENSYGDFKEDVKNAMFSKFTSEIPKEIEESKKFKEYIKNGYTVLYCSNDESSDRVMGIVNIVLVTDHHIKSKDPRININRTYTVFKPFKYRVLPSYVKGKSKTKYLEEELPKIPVCHDLFK
jgi:hypothetical protein